MGLSCFTLLCCCMSEVLFTPLCLFDSYSSIVSYIDLVSGTLQELRLMILECIKLRMSSASHISVTNTGHCSAEFFHL